MGFFPPDHKFAAESASNSTTNENNDKFYAPGKELDDGESHQIIVCGGFDTGHVISGYKYFKNDGQPHTTPFSEGYPKDYKEDIGLNYDAKFNRKIEYGNHTEDDLDKPKQILSFVGYIKEKKDFAITTCSKTFSQHAKHAYLVLLYVTDCSRQKPQCGLLLTLMTSHVRHVRSQAERLQLSSSRGCIMCLTAWSRNTVTSSPNHSLFHVPTTSTMVKRPRSCI